MMHRLNARPEPSQVDRPAAYGPVLGRLVGWLIRPKTKRPEIEFADTRLWTFVWPEETLGRDDEASIEDFAAWLREHGYREITRRQLTSLFWEFVEVTETRPIAGWGRFDKSLKAAGIDRFRLGGGDRSYRYRVALARPKLVAAPSAPERPAELRRAA